MGDDWLGLWGQKMLFLRAMNNNLRIVLGIYPKEEDEEEERMKMCFAFTGVRQIHTRFQILITEISFEKKDYIPIYKL